MNWLICAIAGILSGLIGAMGMGGGGVLIIYFNLFTDIPQSTAQGINLLFFLPTAALAVIYYARKKLIVWSVALRFSLVGSIGTVAGAWLCGSFDNSLLRKLFGVLLLIMGITSIIPAKENALHEGGQAKGTKY